MDGAAMRACGVCGGETDSPEPFGRSDVCCTCFGELLDADELCPECGFGQEAAVLVRSEHSTEHPCSPCLWAYSPPEDPS